MDKKETLIAGRYQVVQELGRGGTSVVYLAEELSKGRRCAVKVIEKSGNERTDAALMKNAATEAELLGRLRHPAIPALFEVIDDGNKRCLVMDYMEGISLEQFVKRQGPTSEGQAAEWAKQLGEILLYLHSQEPPIIYRDMKPGNIILDPGGRLKLIDFGIACEFTEDHLSDRTVFGTRGYASPEQYQGQADQRSDIYALGMTLRCLLTGHEPGTEEGQVSEGDRGQTPSSGLERIVAKCMEPLQKERYQSCGELLRDLEQPWRVSDVYRKKQERRLAVFWRFTKWWILTLLLGLFLSLAAISTGHRTAGADQLEQGLYCLAAGSLAAAAAGICFSAVLWFGFGIFQIYRESDEKERQLLNRTEYRAGEESGTPTEELCSRRRQLLMKEELLIVHTEEELE